MTKYETYILAKAFDTERYNSDHTPQTNDMLGALYNVFIRVWEAMPEPEND